MKNVQRTGNTYLIPPHAIYLLGRIHGLIDSHAKANDLSEIELTSGLVEILLTQRPRTEHGLSIPNLQSEGSAVDEHSPEAEMAIRTHSIGTHRHSNGRPRRILSSVGRKATGKKGWPKGKKARQIEMARRRATARKNKALTLKGMGLGYTEKGHKKAA